MIIGVARERFPGERRVALVPAAVPALVKAGLEVVVERGAGETAGFSDAQYSEKGARLVATRAEVFETDLLLQVRTAAAAGKPGLTDLERIRPGQMLIGMADPFGSPEITQRWGASGATLFALELLPRITRAQSMDVLSSMATVAGYRAVLLAALALPKLFPLLMTAAGTITPAKVLVVGAGVAGLQAISVARRLGGVVSAYDVRPAVKEQVQSLGARFVELALESVPAEAQGGYARQMDDAFYRRQRELLAQVVAESHVVITTAAVPGQRAPVLITAEMVAQMAPGSVIVDLAADRGGNCELTQPGETVVVQGVTILGPLNLPAEVPHDASQMYARNISTFLLHLVKDGQLAINLDDEITRETLIARDGAVVHPRVLEAMRQTPNAALEGKG